MQNTTLTLAKLTLSISTLLIATYCQASIKTSKQTNEQSTNHLTTQTAINQKVNKVINIHTGNPISAKTLTSKPPTDEKPTINVKTSNPINPPIIQDNKDNSHFPANLSDDTITHVHKAPKPTDQYPKYGAMLIQQLDNSTDDSQKLAVIIEPTNKLNEAQINQLQDLFGKVIEVTIRDKSWYTYTDITTLKSLANHPHIKTINLQPITSIPILETEAVSTSHQIPETTQPQNQPKAIMSAVRQSLQLLAQLEMLKPEQTHAISTYGIDQVTKAALLSMDDPSNANRPSWLLPNLGQLNQVNTPLPATYQNFNQIIYRQEMTINPIYAETYQALMVGQAQKLDFKQAVLASKTANSKISKQSQGMINDFYTEDNFHRSDAIISNVLHFKASWQDKFDKAMTQDLDFTNVQGKKHQVPTMIKELEAYVSTLDGWQYVGLPFSDGSMLQLFLTPDEQLTAIPDEAIVTELLHNNRKQKVRLELPRVTLKGDKQSLTELAPEIKDWQLTDLMSGEVLKNPKLQQQVVVSWDEEGAEAAATTAMFLNKSMAVTPPRVAVNRPFVFLIRYDDQVPFAGVVREIK